MGVVGDVVTDEGMYILSPVGWARAASGGIYMLPSVVLARAIGIAGDVGLPAEARAASVPPCRHGPLRSRPSEACGGWGAPGVRSARGVTTPSRSTEGITFWPSSCAGARSRTETVMTGPPADPALLTMFCPQPPWSPECTFELPLGCGMVCTTSSEVTFALGACSHKRSWRRSRWDVSVNTRDRVTTDTPSAPRE